jgi:hypothetical protein
MQSLKRHRKNCWYCVHKIITNLQK